MAAVSKAGGRDLPSLHQVGRGLALPAVQQHLQHWASDYASRLERPQARRHVTLCDIAEALVRHAAVCTSAGRLLLIVALLQEKRLPKVQAEPQQVARAVQADPEAAARAAVERAQRHADAERAAAELLEQEGAVQRAQETARLRKQRQKQRKQVRLSAVSGHVTYRMLFHCLCDVQAAEQQQQQQAATAAAMSTVSAAEPVSSPDEQQPPQAAEPAAAAAEAGDLLAERFAAALQPRAAPQAAAAEAGPGASPVSGRCCV